MTELTDYTSDQLDDDQLLVDLVRLAEVFLSRIEKDDEEYDNLLDVIRGGADHSRN